WEKDLNNDYIVYDLYTIVTCRAEPNSGFIFSSWSGYTAYNTTATNPAPFNVTRYGTLTANAMKESNQVGSSDSRSVYCRVSILEISEFLMWISIFTKRMYTLNKMYSFYRISLYI
ncbi:MAG: hypothetical protein WAM14_10980, partial [Candidatus Nitrosopolaris sp.]